MDNKDTQIKVLQELLRANDKHIAIQEKCIATQAKHIATQEKRISTQEKRISTQEKRISTQAKRIATQAQQIAMLMTQIETLHHRLGLNSSNSSLPPSSDGYSKPAPKSLRVSTKPFGGQKGHQGKTLHQVNKPDEVIQLPISSCLACQEDLRSQTSQAPMKRQVFEIKMHRHVVEYQAENKICTCGKRNIAAFPAGVTNVVQYGNSVKTVGVYLMQQFIAKKRCCELFTDLFGLPISDTTLMAFEAKCANNVTPFYEHIRSELAKAPVKHLDESGLKVDKHTHWLHVLSNDQATYYHLDQKRGITWEGLTGTILHDHWSSYFKIEGVRHALCNAHHLRELQAIIDLHKEPWAVYMQKLLQKSLKGGNPSLISKRYDQIIKKGIAYHEPRPDAN